MYKQAFQTYQPKNEQETKDKELILSFIERNPDALDRTNLTAHITASSIVLNEEFDHILFAFHHIYQSWSWLGGHNDGDPDLLHVAMKEAMEETGIKNIRPLSDHMMMLDVIQVTNHIKHGSYVPDHLHLNATYFFVANQKDELVINHQENSGVKWFSIDDLLNHVSEPRMIPVYQKAIHIINELKKNI